MNNKKPQDFEFEFNAWRQTRWTDDEWASMGHLKREMITLGFEAGMQANRGVRGALRDVEAFHRAGDVPVLRKPQWPSEERVEFRRRLIDEEVNKETLFAMDNCRFVDTADGLVDSIYVICGAMLEFGIPAAVWDEVQRSNMAKVDGKTGKVVRRESDGKILKPEGWTPPDVEGILRMFGWKGES